MSLPFKDCSKFYILPDWSFSFFSTLCFAMISSCNCADSLVIISCCPVSFFISATSFWISVTSTVFWRNASSSYDFSACSTGIRSFYFSYSACRSYSSYFVVSSSWAMKSARSFSCVVS